MRLQDLRFSRELLEEATRREAAASSSKRPYYPPAWHWAYDRVLERYDETVLGGFRNLIGTAVGRSLITAERARESIARVPLLRLTLNNTDEIASIWYVDGYNRTPMDYQPDRITGRGYGFNIGYSAIGACGETRYGVEDFNYNPPVPGQNECLRARNGKRHGHFDRPFVESMLTFVNRQSALAAQTLEALHGAVELRAEPVAPVINLTPERPGLLQGAPSVTIAGR